MQIYNRSFNIFALASRKRRGRGGGGGGRRKWKTYNCPIIFDQLLDRVQQDVRTITIFDLSIIIIIIFYEQVSRFFTIESVDVT